MTPRVLPSSRQNRGTTIFRSRMEKAIKRLSTIEDPPEPPNLMQSALQIEVEVGEQEFTIGNRDDGYELQFFKSTIMADPTKTHNKVSP